MILGKNLKILIILFLFLIAPAFSTQNIYFHLNGDSYNPFNYDGVNDNTSLSTLQNVETREIATYLDVATSEYVLIGSWNQSPVFMSDFSMDTSTLSLYMKRNSGTRNLDYRVEMSEINFSNGNVLNTFSDEVTGGSYTLDDVYLEYNFTFPAHVFRNNTYVSINFKAKPSSQLASSNFSVAYNSTEFDSRITTTTNKNIGISSLIFTNDSGTQKTTFYSSETINALSTITNKLGTQDINTVTFSLRNRSNGQVISSSGMVLDSANGYNSDYSKSFSSLDGGNYRLYVYAKDRSNNNVNKYADFTVESVDTYGPSVSNIGSDPSSNSPYDPNMDYKFNATVTDSSGVDMVLLEFNGKNYTATKNMDEYYLTRTGLAAGTYQYRWYANDTNGNMNSSDLIEFVITKRPLRVDLYKDDQKIESDVTFYYTPDMINMNATVNESDYQNYVNLFKDGIAISNPISESLAANTYNYSTTFSDTQNFSVILSTHNITINKSKSNITIYLDQIERLDGSTVTKVYSLDATNMTVTLNRKQQLNDFALYKNSSLMDSGSDYLESIMALGAGLYEIEANVSESENYTSDSVKINLNIEKAPTDITLYKNNLEWDGSLINVIYPNSEFTINATINVTDLQSNVILDRDGTIKTNPVSEKLGANVSDYIYTASFGGNENYSSSSMIGKVHVDKGITGIDIFLNGTKNANRTEVYPFPYNATAILNRSDVIDGFTFTREYVEDGTSYTITGNSNIRTEIKEDKVGTYIFSASYPGNDNYTSFSRVQKLTLLKRPLSVSFYKDGSKWDSNQNIEYVVDNTIVNVTINNSRFQDKLDLLFDGVIVNNPDSRSLAARPIQSYNYSFNFTDTENFSIVNGERILNVTRGPSIIDLYIDGEKNTDVTKGYTIDNTNISALLNRNYQYGTLKLFRNDTLLDSLDSGYMDYNRSLSAGIYSIKVNISETENYTSNFTEYLLHVNKAPVKLDFYKNDSLWDGSLITSSYPDSTYKIESMINISSLQDGLNIYIDSVEVSNPITKSLAARPDNNYNYTVVFSGNENYSSESKTGLILVNKGSVGVTLLLNGTDEDKLGSNSYKMGDIVNITSYLNVSNYDIALYANYSGVYEKLVTNRLGDVFENLTNTENLGSGLYEVIANFSGNENYSTSVSSHQFEVSSHSAPTISNVKSYPSSGIRYGDTDIYQFNITANDDGQIDTVILEFNGQNYTVSKNNNDVYYHEFANLSTGTHVFSWYVNDTLGKISSTGSLEFIVNKRPLKINLYKNNVEWTGNETIEYNKNETLVKALVNESRYQNNVELLVNSNPSNYDKYTDKRTLSAGVYDYSTTFSDTDNFSVTLQSNELVVNKKQTSVKLYLDGKENDQNYSKGSIVNITVLLNSDHSASLYSNFSGTFERLDTTGINPVQNLTNTSVLESGTYQIIANFSGNDNYTSSESSILMEVYNNSNNDDNTTAPSNPVSGGGSSGGSGPVVPVNADDDSDSSKDGYSFDMDLVLTNHTITRGDYVDLYVTINRITGNKNVGTILTFDVIDENGTVIRNESTIVRIDNRRVENFLIDTNDLVSGRYTIRAKLEYLDNVVDDNTIFYISSTYSDSQSFVENVTETGRGTEGADSQLKLIEWFLISIILAFVTITFYLMLSRNSKISEYVKRFLNVFRKSKDGYFIVDGNSVEKDEDEYVAVYSRRKRIMMFIKKLLGIRVKDEDYAVVIKKDKPKRISLGEKIKKSIRKIKTKRKNS